MSVVVTGACGFVGCNVIERLLGDGRTVIAIDRADGWPPDARDAFAALPGRLCFETADVLDRGALQRAFALADSHGGIDGVIHGAAITPGPRREANAAAVVVDVNVVGTMRVLAAARRQRARRVVFPSSASVYGAAAFPDRPLDEARDVPLPDTVYAVSKYAAERLALRARELWGMDVIAARVGAVFGPWERDTGVRDTLSGPMLATRALLRREPVFLNRPGPRDWVYALDAAAALVTLLDEPSPQHQLFHVSGGGGWTLTDWCRVLGARVGAESLVVVDPDHAPSIPLPARARAPLGIDRLRSLYVPRYGLEAAVDNYLAWLRGRSPGWHAAW